MHRTPLASHRQLGAGVCLKAESLQVTGSFKARGALNRVLTLSAADRARGIITVSAGNHAAAVAWAARVAGVPCAVVMPADAPASKVAAVQGYGAAVIAHPDRPTLFDRLATEREARGLTFVHPFDDPVVLAGAGTVGLEIAGDLSDVALVLVPVGGGGLLGGVASALAQRRPAARVVAVELAAGPGLQPALDAGRPVPVSRPATLADGLTPPFVGARPLAIAQAAVAEVVGVTEPELRAAMRWLAGRAKLVAEAAGAATVAALLAGTVRPAPHGATVAIVSGGNVDAAVLADVLSETGA